MTEVSGRDLGRIEGRLDEFIEARASRDRQTDQRLDRIETKVQLLLDAANMGKGAWWLLLKIGGVMTAFGAVLSYLVEKIRW